METLSRRDFWKKRAFYGYKPSYVQTLIGTKQANFDTQKKDLLDEMELLKEKNQKLREDKAVLEEQRPQQDTLVAQKEIMESITQTYLKGVSQQLQLKEELGRQKEDVLRRLEEKQIERDKLVSRLKAVMNDLHLKIGEMGED